MDPTILGHRQKPPLECGVFQAWILDDGNGTAGKSGVMEFAVVPRSNPPPPHVHHELVESFYILDGEVELWAEGETRGAGPGTFVQIPAGTAHTYHNPGDRELRFLAFFTPADFVGFFRELEVLVRTGQMNPAANSALLNKYDTDVVKR